MAGPPVYPFMKKVNIPPIPQIILDAQAYYARGIDEGNRILDEYPSALPLDHTIMMCVNRKVFVNFKVWCLYGDGAGADKNSVLGEISSLSRIWISGQNVTAWMESVGFGGSKRIIDKRVDATGRILGRVDKTQLYNATPGIRPDLIAAGLRSIIVLNEFSANLEIYGGAIWDFELTTTERDTAYDWFEAAYL